MVKINIKDACHIILVHSANYDLLRIICEGELWTEHCIGVCLVYAKT